MKKKLQEIKETKVPNAVKFYTFLERVSRENMNRIIMLTGTPILKHPYELALYANVLHPNKEILPSDI